MEETTKVTLEALNRYFNTLAKFGYKNYNSVNKLIVLTFLEELLSQENSVFVTEEDYNDIISAIYNLSGTTCMIDFPEYNIYDSIIRKQDFNDLGIMSEDYNLRMCEGNYIKVKM